MDYVADIFGRVNLQQIRSFLTYGTETSQMSEKNYKERLSEVEQRFFKRIDEKFPNSREQNDIVNIVYEYVGITQNVYMEIGMRCGARLVEQLLSNS